MQWKKSTMAAGHVLRPLWGHTPGNEAYNNQLTIKFYGSASLNQEKTLTITINITISARHVNEDVQQQCNDDKTMGTVQPAGRC
jgi:hypothetical protein